MRLVVKRETAEVKHAKIKWKHGVQLLNFLHWSPADNVQHSMLKGVNKETGVFERGTGDVKHAKIEGGEKTQYSMPNQCS